MMAKDKPTRAAIQAPTSSDKSAAAGAIAWPRWARVVVTLVLLWHLAAVVLPPLRVPPSSVFWQAVSVPFMPYIEALDLRHGYRFFGPEPGPSHLVQYDLTLPDGSHRQDHFPNRAEEKPRLLYHRYFMLSEHLNAMYEEWVADKENQAPPSICRRAEEQFRQTAHSFADELLRRSGAKSVHLELVEHRFPSPDEFLAGKRLDDPAYYRTLIDLGTFTEQRR